MGNLEILTFNSLNFSETNCEAAHDRSILEGYERAIDNFRRKYEEKVMSTNQIVAFKLNKPIMMRSRATFFAFLCRFLFPS